MLILERLRKISTKFQKELCLKKASDIDQAVLEYALNPYKVYHLKTFKVMEFEEGEPSLEMLYLLDDILEGKLRGNAAKDAVNTFALNNGSLIKKICQKNLRCGVNAKTINSVWSDLIPMFEVQLAKEVPINTITYPKLVQIKYDGVRIIAIKKDDKITFRTRNGKEVNLPILAKAIRKIDGDIILDGEMTISSGKLEDRTKVSGMINSAMHGGQIDEYLLMYNIFDTMILSHWEAMKCPVIYTHRLKMVRLLVDQISNCGIDVAFTFKAVNRATLEKQYDMFIKLGYEGLILKDENHLYTFKRTKDWIKLKEIKEVDLICYDIIEGEGKYKGAIGSLRCTGTVEGKEVYVDVGTGLTDSDRELPDHAFVNKTIEVKYNSIIMDRTTTKYSLFLPRFVEVRYDK